MSRRLSNTQLNDRTLWYDGDSTVPPEMITEMIALGMPVDGLFVEHLSEDIKRYNQFVTGEERITVKNGVRPFDLAWNIPEFFQTMDIETHLRSKLADEGVARGWLDPDDMKTRPLGSEMQVRIKRVREELALYESLGLTDVLRVLIYVINTLQANKVVWGVGRGSSVASYVLYLIGVHDIDSIDYDLDITDFLRDEGSSGE